jgi:phosphate transport system permease protein
MAEAVLGVRAQISAASRRIARLKRIDRAAGVLITLGGIGIVASVVGILVFITAEAWPLFLSARSEPPVVVRPPSQAFDGSGLRAFGVDEYQRYFYTVEPDGRAAFYRVSDGALAKAEVIAGLEGVRVTSSSRTLLGDFVAAGAADGRVALLQMRFAPRYDGQRLADVDVEVRSRGLVVLDPGGRAIRQVSYREREGRKAVAGLASDAQILLWQTNDAGEERRASLEPAGVQRFTAVRLGSGEDLIAGDESGQVYHWDLGDDVPRLTSVSRASDRPVTALEWLLGGSIFVAGDAAGALSGWFRARLDESDSDLSTVRARLFAPQGAAITAITAAPRDKSFAVASADGAITLRHATSGRTVLRLQSQEGPAALALIAPKSDALLTASVVPAVVVAPVHNPHPEATWRTLFGKVWYEGYARPEYVWQSTGATDDFEPKLSLVPLVFGTIKATLYALLFAIPLAVFGALYTSQFVHPNVRNLVKPTVEIMAALPSVVIGFLAGLWLAPLVERNLATVALALILAPAFGTSGFLVWNRLPAGLARRLKPGMELIVIAPLLVAGFWLAALVSPWVERVLFAGDARLWLLESLGVNYDQRNSLVVGIAMGFAVIPIIFTISEDAFSTVPSNLSAASLALGASRWQTAIRVVLPTASPGVFSAIMVGFGRAVGETMIVLMATGNTPIMDWSIFNGMRTLSANIAVEIPEAPHGGTLYRTLFLAAALLFLLTFILNTAAEIIRQRLRERYRAL